MDFERTAQQRRWRDLARSFAQQVIRPRAEALDRALQFPYDSISRMAKLGLMGLPLPPEYSGCGSDVIPCGLALEEISHADTSAIPVAVHMSPGLRADHGLWYGRRGGTVEEKERFWVLHGSRRSSSSWARRAACRWRLCMLAGSACASRSSKPS